MCNFLNGQQGHFVGAAWRLGLGLGLGLARVLTAVLLSAIPLVSALAIAQPAQAQSQTPGQIKSPSKTPATYPGIGRPAVPSEIKAWDIDVRPDFKGLPKGQGSVAQGEKLWEAQCASCHGSFAESNEVFPPLVGYTSAQDAVTGRVASLQLGSTAPTRTSMMKLSQLSTLWDYINRAMPWTAPKTLQPNEVYAVTAYLLNLANVVPDDFTLRYDNMAQVQNMLPNRNGMTTAHALWPGAAGQSDVQGSSCTKNCTQTAVVASFIPDYAKSAHGNLAEQSRNMGGTRGAVTLVSQINEQKPLSAGVSIAKSAPKTGASEVMPLLQKYACVACHAMDSKLVGPSFKAVLAQQGQRADAASYLAGKIRAGGMGVYGQIPMPAQALSGAEAAKIADWLVQGMQK